MTKKKTVPTMELETFTDGLDQPLKIKAITFGKSFKLIDAVLEEAKARKTDIDVHHLLSNFATAGQVIGVSLAKLLYGALQIWPEITGAEYKDMNDRRMHFTQTMFSKYGYSKTRVERYLLAWEFMERHKKKMDAKTQERFLSRPIKDLIALGQNCREGGDFNGNQLRTLAAAEDNTTLRQKIAKIRTGDELNSEVMGFRRNEDGTLEAWEGNRVATLGYLSRNEAGAYPDQGTNDLHDRALARLLRRGQIKEE